MGDCVGASPPQTPIWFIPQAPRGDERPGDGVPVPASVPRIRRHNIIPSGLCNNRQQRQLHASTKVIIQAIGTRPSVLPGGRLHTPDYVKKAPSEGCEGFPFELPGEAAAGKALPVGRDHPSLKPGAPHFARGYISVGANSRAQSAAPHHRHQYSTDSSPPGASVQCGQPAALIASLGVGPAPKVVCPPRLATPPLAPFLQGRV